MRMNETPRGSGKFARAHQWKRRWLAAVTCMAALVVFCTVYALVMPATALEKKTYCGMEEHTHDDSCYESVLICGQEEGSGHVHDESCYEQELTCGKTEHTHTDECYVEPVSETSAAEETETGADTGSETEAAALPDGAQVPDGYTQQYTARDDANGFAVTVYAPDGAVPDGAKLSAELLTEDDDAYLTAEEALAENNADTQSEDSEDAESDYGFAAMDIHFEDANGNEVEPDGDVYVVIDAAGLLPEGADTESITVQHHVEKNNGDVTVETVADTADETEGVVVAQADEDSENSGVQAAFEVKSFSTFTIYYYYGSSSLTVQIIDSNGRGIGKGSLGYTTISSETSINTIVSRVEEQSGSQLNGYSFDRAVVASSASNAIDNSGSVQRIRRSDSRWQYSTQTSGNSWSRINNTLYLIYNEDSSSGQPGMEKVYVYVAATGLSQECLDLLGIESDTLDANGYFPAGEIYLDTSYFDGKSGANTPGQALINSDEDWQQLLAALGDMNTNTLMNQTNWNYSGATVDGRKDYSANRENLVGDYLEQARGDIGQTWGSQCTALFRWHLDPSVRGQAHYGFEDQSVKYHLDLFFTTNTINFVLGNNGITRQESQNAYDGHQVDTRTYITGSEIQPPRNLNIPDGYYFDGYYEDADFTRPWNGIGTPLTQDETVYIKLSKSPVLALTITKEVSGTTVKNKDYTFTISTTDSNVAGQTYSTSTGVSITFTDQDDNRTYTAQVTLRATSLNGVDGSVLIYGLPTGANTTYTVKENKTSAAIAGYQLENVAYTVNGENGNTVTTGQGSSATTAATVAVTNTYTQNKGSLTIIKNIYGLSEDEVVGLIDGSYSGEGQSGLRFDVDYFTDAATLIDDENADDNTDRNEGDWTFDVDDTVDYADGTWTPHVTPGTGNESISLGEEDHYTNISLQALQDDEGNTYYRYEVTIEDIDPNFWYRVWELHVDVEGYNLTSTVEEYLTGQGADSLDNYLTSEEANSVRGDHGGRATAFQLTTDTTVEFTNRYTPATADVTFKKVDGSNTDIALPDAEFLLYYTVTEEVGGESVEKTYYYQKNNGTIEWVENRSQATPLKSGEDGRISIVGLPVGTTYYLVETKAPNGYNLLEDVIQIGWQENEAYPSINGTPLTNISEDTEPAVYLIKNSTGAKLPNTGGPGTTYVTIGGLLLMAAAVGGGYGLRRRRRREGR